VSGHLVTVTKTKHRDHGGRKTIDLKTFELDEANSRWIYYPASRLTKKLDGTGANVDAVLSAMMSQDHGRLVANGTAWIIDGVEVPVTVANIIFNAVRSAGGHKVDLGGIEWVMSHLGPQIAELRRLPAEQRRHAEAALYSLIIERCNTV
jgi:hypothetical protein